MIRYLLLSILCVLFSVALPALVYVPPLPAPEPRTQAAPAAEGVTVTLLRDGETAVLPLEEYLVGAVAAEMPASFHPQALRAQAVASRTFALYRRGEVSGRHPRADLCGDPGCCQAWLSEAERAELWGDSFQVWEAAVRAAAEDTAGVCLTWRGEPILACFHASSPGVTESSGAVWGTALPYLVSVDTPEGEEDVPGFVTSVRLSADELRRGVREIDPRAPFDGEPETWVGQRVLDTGGRVAALRVGGVTVPGSAVRETFSLRSACFTLVWTGEDFLFTVEGGGHGVGMSQYGAQAMARQGADWREILAHYYPGAELSDMSS